MKIGNRPLAMVFGALFKKQHYTAGARMLTVYERPLEMFARYLTAKGRYPASVGVRTPAGRLGLDAYSSHDLLTINEIFCRGDYAGGAADEVIVDFGSNIGISAAYFLSRNASAFAYLYEPLAQNVERLKRNLAFAEGRYEVHQIAVGLENGKVRFGWEESGRYGGIGQATGNYIEVECRDSNAVLAGIIDKHGRIDALKIDIETLERQVVERIPDRLRPHIQRIFAEYQFQSNPLAETHNMRQYGSVAQFTLR